MADSLQTSNDGRSAFLLQGRLHTVVRVTWLLIAILSIGLALAAFSEVARDEVDMDQLTAELLRVVEKTMQPESMSLWLKEINSKPQ